MYVNFTLKKYVFFMLFQKFLPKGATVGYFNVNALHYIYMCVNCFICIKNHNRYLSRENQIIFINLTYHAGINCWLIIK